MLKCGATIDSQKESRRQGLSITLNTWKFYCSSLLLSNNKYIIIIIITIIIIVIILTIIIIIIFKIYAVKCRTLGEYLVESILYNAIMSCDSISTNFPMNLLERAKLGLTSRNLLEVSQVLLIIFNDNVCFQCY